ncbi:MAG TPA: hypothetical protein VFK04_08850 [Gemmatimonadaceae bacterium]|nr:hypothetical protein [Gemmatimonadaceae bacterium]
MTARLKHVKLEGVGERSKNAFHIVRVLGIEVGAYDIDRLAG